MPYCLQPFAYLGGYDRSGIRYLWSDTRASKDFAFPPADAEAIAEQTEAASLRARLALCTALFEIIAARFVDLDPDPYPSLFLESAWASLVDKRYAHYDERQRSAWLGPIRGPLWCGFSWLGPALHFSDDDASEWQSTLIYLVRLAHHVVPCREALAEWLDGSVRRIVRFHPQPAVAPLDDLFGQQAERRRGHLVGRSCFDLTQAYAPEPVAAEMTRYLQQLEWSRNPLLKSPDQLLGEHLPCTPYETVVDPVGLIH